MEQVKSDVIVQRLNYKECKRLHESSGKAVSEWVTSHGLVPFWLRSTNGGDTYEVGIKRQAILRIHEDDQVDIMLGCAWDDGEETRQLVELLGGWCLQWYGGKRMLGAEFRDSRWAPTYAYLGHNEGDSFRVPCNITQLPPNGMIPYYHWAKQAWFDVMPSIPLSKGKYKASKRRNPILKPLLGDVISLNGSDHIYVIRSGIPQFVPYLGDHAEAHLVYTDPSRTPLDWDLSNDLVRMLANATDWKRKDRYYCELVPRSN